MRKKPEPLTAPEAISQALGVSRITVRKYLRLDAHLFARLDDVREAVYWWMI